MLLGNGAAEDFELSGNADSDSHFANRLKMINFRFIVILSPMLA